MNFILLEIISLRYTRHIHVFASKHSLSVFSVLVPATLAAPSDWDAYPLPVFNCTCGFAQHGVITGVSYHNVHSILLERIHNLFLFIFSLKPLPCTIVKWKFLATLETQLCPVMFFWKLPYERVCCWKQTCRRIFC